MAAYNKNFRFHFNHYHFWIRILYHTFFSTFVGVVVVSGFSLERRENKESVIVYIEQKCLYFVFHKFSCSVEED